MFAVKLVFRFTMNLLTETGNTNIAVLLLMFASLEKQEAQFVATKDARGLTAVDLAKSAGKSDLASMFTCFCWHNIFRLYGKTCSNKTFCVIFL